MSTSGRILGTEAKQSHVSQAFSRITLARSASVVRYQFGPNFVELIGITAGALLFEYYAKWVKIRLQDFTLTNEPKELDL